MNGKGVYISKRRKKSNLSSSESSTNEFSSQKNLSLKSNGEEPNYLCFNDYESHLKSITQNQDLNYTNQFFSHEKKIPQHEYKQFNHGQYVNRIIWDDLGNLLASASMDKTVKIWDVFYRQRCCLCIKAHSEAVKDIAFAYPSNNILSVGFDGFIGITDILTGKTTQKLNHKEMINTIRVHPKDGNGNIFITGGFHGSLYAWDAREPSKKPAQRFDSELGPHLMVRYKDTIGDLQSCAFFTSGNEFVSTSSSLHRNAADKMVVVWDFRSGAPLSNQVYHESYTCPRAVLHPSGNNFLLQSNANEICVFSTKYPFRKHKHKNFKGHLVNGHPIGCDINSEGSIVVSGSAEGKTCFYDWKTSRLIKSFHVFPLTCIDVAFHPFFLSTTAFASRDGLISVRV
eukprot:gb/GECH01005381.1/.p1 GENE.gb/GECH01005381.1/~~gb/GECH01005381.1/.p1  ORF type:complete len:399 (+),score=81.87 gb/GECH01005381.1/:1-1197(+)